MTWIQILSGGFASYRRPHSSAREGPLVASGLPSYCTFGPREGFVYMMLSMRVSLTRSSS